MYFFVILIEIVVLFLSSRHIFNSLYLIFHRILKSERVAIIPLSIIFFPGVVIHELSHMFMAEILFVKTHELDLTPDVHQGSVKMGSVKISQTDPIRRMVIGVAPVIGGLSLIMILLYFLPQAIFSPWTLYDALFKGAILWLVFVITNTMFSSRKDMEGFFETLVLVGFLGFVLFIFFTLLKIDAVHYVSLVLLNERVMGGARDVALYLTIPVGLNIAAVFIGRFFAR